MIHVMLAAIGMLVAKSNAGTSPLGIAGLVFVCLGVIGIPIYYVFKSRQRP